MKKILVACDPIRMDASLRRSLTHLVKSCEISVVNDGYAAFDEISGHPFDLLVVDFELSGIDSLEFVESVQYIDPGVPVILMLQEEHKSIKSTAYYLKARPIECPFKPLKFLRLVDKLLHQQLNRYRQLASTLETTLETLRRQTDTPCAFLVEENGQVLLFSGEIEEILLVALSNLVIGVSVLDEELKRLFARDDTLYARYQQAERDHGLYVVHATESLRLALLSPPTVEPQQVQEIWYWLDQAALETQQAFGRYNQGISSEPTSNEQAVGQPEISTLDHVFIPVFLKTDEYLPEAMMLEEQDEYGVEDEVAVNWEIISSNSNLLTRLHNLTRSD